MPYVAPTTSSNPQPLPINRYSARSSYFGASGYHPSPGLERARRPFRTKNALTGLLILSFVGGVYSYSISAVKQDDFSDLPTVSAADREGRKSIEEEMAEKQQQSLGNRGIGAMMGMGSSPQGQGVKVTEQPDAKQQQQRQYGSGQMTPLSTPLPPPPGARTVGAAAANAIVQTAPVTASANASARQKSRLIVGAPEVDRLGKLGERSDVDPSIDGRRVV